MMERLNDIDWEDLFLVGSTALFIAAKYDDEASAPSVGTSERKQAFFGECENKTVEVLQVHPTK